MNNYFRHSNIQIKIEIERETQLLILSTDQSSTDESKELK